MKFGVEDVHALPLSKYEFPEISAKQAVLYIVARKIFRFRG